MSPSPHVTGRELAASPPAAPTAAPAPSRSDGWQRAAGRGRAGRCCPEAGSKPHRSAASQSLRAPPSLWEVPGPAPTSTARGSRGHPRPSEFARIFPAPWLWENPLPRTTFLLENITEAQAPEASVGVGAPIEQRVWLMAPFTTDTGRAVVGLAPKRKVP